MPKISTLLFLAIVITGTAQEVVRPNWQVGLQVATQYVTSNLVPDVKGPGLSLQVSRRIYKHWSIETGGKMDFLKYNYKIMRSANEDTFSTVNARMFVLSIPVLAGYTITESDRFQWKCVAGITNRAIVFEEHVSEVRVGAPDNSYKVLETYTNHIRRTERILPSFAVGTEAAFRMISNFYVSARAFYESPSFIQKEFTYSSLGIGAGLRYAF